MCLVPPHMHSKTHLKQSNKCGAYDSPYVTAGRTGQSRVFSTTQLLSLEICLVLIVSLFKRSVKALTPCSSRFLRKVLLDDTWAEVSSFRGNGERIGKGGWAPLNTTEELDLKKLSGAINTAQATGGTWEVKPHSRKINLFFHSKVWEFKVYISI